MMTPRSSPMRLVLGDALSRQPQHVERADQVDLDDLLEGVQREGPVLAQRLGRIADTGAVDVDAQRAHRLGDVERLAHRGLVGDVGLDELGPITELGDGLFTSQVDHDDGRPRVEQSLRGRQAQPGGTAGDDGYGVFDLH